jgi:hypothetical protein
MDIADIELNVVECEPDMNDPASRYFQEHLEQLVTYFEFENASDIDFFFDDVCSICRDCNYIPTQDDLYQRTCSVPARLHLSSTIWYDYCAESIVKIIAAVREIRQELTQYRLQQIVDKPDTTVIELDALVGSDESSTFDVDMPGVPMES